MTVAIYAGSFLKGISRQKVQKAIPVFVVIVGIFFILRGMGLGIPYVSPKPVTEIVDSKMECHWKPSNFLYFKPKIKYLKS